MKVVFVGSFSTGKTTMANLFADEWRYPRLPQVERHVVELGFPLDQSATAETETLIFLKQWHTELEHDRFVSDYSLFHVLAYADWVMENAAERKENHLWREAREIATFGLSSRYDHVFYLPIEFPIVPDELRPDDPAFQAEIDSRVHRLLDTYGVPYHTLTGSIEERQDRVRALVSDVADRGAAGR